MTAFLAASGLAFGVAFLATGCLRLLIQRLGVLDRPNERSAHEIPTPTLGGLGILVGFWVGLAGGEMFGVTTAPWLWKALLAAGVVLLVLVYDEVKSLGCVAKLVVQSMAALAVLCWAEPGVRGITDVTWTAVGWFVGLVAIQNFYTFMDGLDGLAGLEGAIVGSLFLVTLMAAAPELAVPAAVAGAACAGFLVWNAPPAKIFMGDVGSHFLGLTFGVLALGGVGAGVSVVVPLLFLGAFLYDALYTLFRRLLRGDNITRAHRFHLYQRLQVLGLADGTICTMYAVVTLLLGGSGCLLHLGMPGPAAGGITAGGLMLVATTVWVERQQVQNDGRKDADGV